MTTRRQMHALKQSGGAAWLSGVLMLAACTGAGQAVTDAFGFAPLVPGGAASAYMHLTNVTDNDLHLSGFDSPQFERVELHETVEQDGMARMRPVSNVRIAPGATLQLAPGGKHLMLMNPRASLGAGTVVSVTIHFENAPSIVTEFTLRNRAAGRGVDGPQ